MLQLAEGVAVAAMEGGRVTEAAVTAVAARVEEA